MFCNSCPNFAKQQSECRGHAPVVSGGRSGWPRTSESDWCNEHPERKDGTHGRAASGVTPEFFNGHIFLKQNKGYRCSACLMFSLEPADAQPCIGKGTRG